LTRTADIGDVVRGTLADHRPTPCRRALTLRHDSAPDLPSIEADVPALASVFANLLIAHDHGRGDDLG
jgi:hypothetical protein